MHSLDGPGLKFDHGSRHLEVLTTLIGQYLASRPYQIVESATASPDEHILWIDIVQSPPLEISLTLGDCLHDFRSSLDHLMWQLVLATGGTPSPATQFPIFLTESLFKSLGARMTRGLTDRKALNFISSQQPFTTTLGDVDPLWYLHDLSNRDKHRLLEVTALYIDRFTLGTFWRMPHSGLRIDYGPFQQGRQVLAHVPFDVAGPTESVLVDPHMTLVLEDARMHRDALSRMDTIRARVHGVLHDARPFF